MYVCMCVYTYTCIAICSNIFNIIQLKTYNQNIIIYIFVKGNQNQNVVEWETLTKTNLTENNNVTVNILANVLIVLKLRQSDTVELLNCSLVTLPVDLPVSLCTIFALKPQD